MCDAFYQCDHGNRLSIEYCPGNLVFNGEIIDGDTIPCDYPENITCRKCHVSGNVTCSNPTTTLATATSTTTTQETTKDMTTITTTAASKTSTYTKTMNTTTTSSITTTTTTSTSKKTTTVTITTSTTTTNHTPTTTTSTATTTTNSKTTKTMTSMNTSSSTYTSTITSAMTSTTTTTITPTTPTYSKDYPSQLGTTDICPDGIYAHPTLSLAVALCCYFCGVICGIFINSSVSKKRNTNKVFQIYHCVLPIYNLQCQIETLYSFVTNLDQ